MCKRACSWTCPFLIWFHQLQQGYLCPLLANCCCPPADSIYTSLWEAFDGLGLNWRFAEAAASKQSWAACLTRILAVCISIGGSLVTALLLGLTSGGDRTNCRSSMPSKSSACLIRYVVSAAGKPQVGQTTITYCMHIKQSGNAFSTYHD